MNRKMLFAFAALVVALTASAQEPNPFGFVPPDSLGTKEFTLPDSLAHYSPWRQDYRKAPRLEQLRPVVSMTSIIAIPYESLPSRVTVLNDNTLRVTPHLTISNGQAWNWGIFPDSYLDARTLSFPLPR